VDAVHEALHQLGVTPDLVSSSNDLMLYAEGWIDLDYEIAVMVVRSSSSTKCYPAVTAIHQNSICRVVLAPARYISPAIQDMAQQYAMDAIDSLPGSVGVGVGEDRMEECVTQMEQENNSDGFTTVTTKREKRAKHVSRISKKVNDIASNNCKSVSRVILLKQSS
jgi:ATP-grasp domain